MTVSPFGRAQPDIERSRFSPERRQLLQSRSYPASARMNLSITMRPLVRAGLRRDRVGRQSAEEPVPIFFLVVLDRQREPQGGSVNPPLRTA